MSNNSYDKDFWNQRYDSENYVYGVNPNEFLIENIKQIRPCGRVLCLSEGEGRNAVFLAKKGFDVTCIDISEIAKEKALKLASLNSVKINYLNLDLNNFEFKSNSWDAIISIFAHTKQNLRQKILKCIKESLVAEGLFILEGYNLDQLNYNSGGPKDIQMFFDKTELENYFFDFKILITKNIIRMISEGDGHNGNSSVVQFIARK